MIVEASFDAASNSVTACFSVDALTFLAGFLFVFLRTLLLGARSSFVAE